MAVIRVDGRSYEVDGSDNLLSACLSLGLDLPYFCWHPALGSVGACRQCAVKQHQDRGGRIVMACMTPAADGTSISIEDAEAREFRRMVAEWLMVGHPHDCPVCDEGGECHLQDMTLMAGQVYRRYRYEKRTFHNQWLGPFVHHEMNRCIACYRCVRFYREHAGGRDLDVFGCHHHVYFGRAEDGVLESEFAGNLAEVCPTGVFTDETLHHHYVRKWDLQDAPSVCVHCGLGCNTIAGERSGTLRRIRNRFHAEVNGHFLCDRGRFGYGFVNAPGRLREVNGDVRPDLLAGRHVLGIGSPRASLEANFALRALVGPDAFHAGTSALEDELVRKVVDILRAGPARIARPAEAACCDAVLVLGEDPSDTAPILALALRQSVRVAPMKIADRLKVPRWNDAAVRDAVQDAKGPLHVVTPAPTRLDDVATSTRRAAPDDVARLGFAVARELDPEAPAVEGLAGADRELARRIAADLAGAERPLVVSGTGAASPAVLEAAAAVARALSGRGEARIALTVPESDSLGLALLEPRPLAQALDAVRTGRAGAVVVLENDLYRRAESADVDALLASGARVVVIDHTRTPTAERAEVVLPAATFAEAAGTRINQEGRAQRAFEVFAPRAPVRSSWRWIVELSNGRLAWRTLDDVLAALAQEVPALAAAAGAAPGHDHREVGQLIPRMPPRYSGRTAIVAGETVHEPRPPADPDGPLAHSMEGFAGRPDPALVPFYWAPGWNSVQALRKYRNAGEIAPGPRLIEPDREGRPSGTPPPAFRPRDGEVLVVPLPRVFGSEELSNLSPPIAERSGRPHLVLSPAAAEGLPDEVALEVSGRTLRLAVRVEPALARGVAGLEVGFPGLPFLSLPAPGRVSP